MAGDWLKVEAATPDKPEVFEIAMQLKIQPAEAFGRLFLVWRWFDQHTESGNATNVTSAYLDHIAGVPGFAEAMKNVGWLTMKQDGSFGCSLPNFDRHNGKTAKTRGLTAKRVATHKLRSANAQVTHTALPREEKRREDKNNRELGFEEFYQAYPKKVAKPAAKRAWVAQSFHNGDVEKVMAALEAHKRTEKWRKDDGEYIPNPATWLNQRRFDDPVGPPAMTGVV